MSRTESESLSYLLSVVLFHGSVLFCPSLIDREKLSKRERTLGTERYIDLGVNFCLIAKKIKTTHLSPLLLQDKNLCFQSDVTAGSF